MKKALIVATIDINILAFHIPLIKLLKENGYEVHVASNGEKEMPFVDKKYNICFSRSPYKKSNFTAYKELKKIIDENNYDIIHCHTPVGGALTRLAARKARKNGTRVIYTAHGFHFYSGSSKKSRIFYYPVEKYLSRYTDCLITINSEDYATAVRKKFRAKEIYHVHGVGVNLDKFEQQTEDAKLRTRKKYGYRPDDFILFYAAEMNANKHQDLLIKALSLLKEDIPNIKLILAGKGSLQEYYEELAEKYGVSEYVDFLGFRKDVKNLLMLSDIGVASSRREGLPVNVMEAMATGLPVIATDIRGQRDLIKNGYNGYLVDVDDYLDFTKKIKELYLDKNLRHQLGHNGATAIEEYSVKNVIEEMSKIYFG